MASIDLARVYDRLEACFAQGDLTAAEQLLLYWRAEALSVGDDVGVKQIDNELIGLYRRTDDSDKAMAVAERLLPCLEEDNVGDATILLNIATDFCHFGCPERALPLYQRAEAVYLRRLAPDDYRKAGLYNNMATYYLAVADYATAEAMYRKALDVLRLIRPTMAEMAVTYVNLAACIYCQTPLDPAVDDNMRAAFTVLCLPILPHDGNFAFVLSKVMPMFEHLGYADESAALSAMLAGCTADG